MSARARRQTAEKRAKPTTPLTRAPYLNSSKELGQDLKELELLLRLRSAEVVRIHARGTFGSEEKAVHWMNRPNALFNGRKPGKVLLSDPEAVEAELVRIDHGVYV